MIQSNEGFSLYDLAEIRCFLAQISRDRIPVISAEMWTAAINHLTAAYSKSNLLAECLDLLEQFFSGEEKKYLTDLEDFLYEAKLSDFYKSSGNEILVSTIHKSKGHEFDHVYIALKTLEESVYCDRSSTFVQSRTPLQNHPDLNADLRKVYVGITRAKSSLSVFYNNHYFHNIAGSLKSIGIQERYDPTNFPHIGEIIMPLTHKDIYLSFSGYGNRSQIIDTLRSGDCLHVQEETNEVMKLFFAVSYRNTLFRVACASKEFCKKIQRYKEKGYSIFSAEVLFVLKWRNKETAIEHSILLPIIRLKQN